MNFTNSKKYPEEIKRIPYLGYFNHNKNNFNSNFFLIKDIDKFKYKSDYLNSNPYLGYINHSKLFELEQTTEEKEIQCDYDYSFLIDTVIQKYKLCNKIKTKETSDKGIQCNISNEEDFEIVKDEEYQKHGIPRSSFLSVGDYLYKLSTK